ncbi:site-specific DNA-methyltransferase [Candidatus Saccharibacteria bacterium CPR2]|nr:site-specific DNA-methyltransferase [Candidatus Saccharibacteria bacterium CPR2]
MILSDNEKRDVIKYLEAGKPLPEKYRFLLFEDDREVELLWNGKTDEVTTTVLPFQVIEQIDEPRSDDRIGLQSTLFDDTGRQITGWTNKLIWGDNKLILSSLKNGPMRKEIEAQGGLKLIYIDPPFDVGADFSMELKIGEGDDEETFTKRPSIIEEVAYRDTWGKGADSFIAMIYERLRLMNELLADDGTIYVHCDWRVSGYMRLVLDEIFGKNNFVNEIIWQKVRASKGQAKAFGNVHDTIFAYRKNDYNKFNKQYGEHDEARLKSHYNNWEKDGRQYQLADFTQKGQGEPKVFGDKGLLYPPTGKHWIWSQERIDEGLKDGLIIFTDSGKPRVKRYLDTSQGSPIEDIWNDIFPINSQAKESVDYPTQKPETLLERIIKTSSDEGDLIADFFVGSGTTLAVAEKMGRKWIGSDLGKFSIHTSRKRMIDVQRKKKKDGEDFRAFEILNVGRYERENYVDINDDLRAEERAKQAKHKENAFVQLILSAYKAEPVESFVNFVGKKRDRLVAVGPISTPVSSKQVHDIVSECKDKGITKVDILGFDYEMGLDFQEYADQGVDVAFRIIPREVFDKKAVERGHVKFYDVAFIEAMSIVKGPQNKKELTIELTDFSVFYNQDDSGEVSETLKPGGSKVIVEDGQVVKITKNKDGGGEVKEIITKKWSDWIDYWAVDFNFADRKEIIKVLEGDEEKEVWTGDYIFDNEWQSFRTKKNRNLELTSAAREIVRGKHKVAIKVVDIFGNDTTKVIEVEV